MIARPTIDAVKVLTRVVALSVLVAPAAAAQVLSERGFVEARGQIFPEEVPRDTERQIGDLLFRQDVFVKPSDWLRLSGGLDFRANSHDQVEDDWSLNFDDRTTRRPRLAVRRLSANLSAGHLSVDLGKQFIRWGRADILNPTDRFAPRDYLTVIDTEFLPVLGARAAVQVGPNTFEGVWVPRFTPSRLPLLDQRWTIVPAEAAGVTLLDGGSVFPKGSQFGARWSHAGERVEAALAFFDGFNHLPNIDVIPVGPAAAQIVRRYPELRSYGGDLAIPGSVVTIKGEAAYLTSPSETNSDYVLYVIELERQVGEWVFDGGYAGEVVTNDRGTFRFGPDEGVAKSFIGRVAYTLGPQRSVAIEGAARQSGDGLYVKGEFSEAIGQHWRVTFAGVGLRGNESDFLGQYRHNSNVSVALRFSY